ncbi:hypothetical protein HaLaN_31004 [Haematococcus lacustris]|uniref:Uncharacterized protein n=1 Tax=Haematococcus lacustris TaxID=44745 RepID=A0A6A0AHV5_HAELA|nr:hypothetical protein HaLaN_31004 [Haematococcus lacustris]
MPPPSYPLDRRKQQVQQLPTCASRSSHCDRACTVKRMGVAVDYVVIGVPVIGVKSRTFPVIVGPVVHFSRVHFFPRVSANAATLIIRYAKSCMRPSTPQVINFSVRSADHYGDITNCDFLVMEKDVLYPHDAAGRAQRPKAHP